MHYPNNPSLVLAMPSDRGVNLAMMGREPSRRRQAQKSVPMIVAGHQKISPIMLQLNKLQEEEEDTTNRGNREDGLTTGSPLCDLEQSRPNETKTPTLVKSGTATALINDNEVCSNPS